MTKTRFGGKGVQDAVRCVNTEINDALQGYDVRRQKEIDNCLIALDGTENKGRLGAKRSLAYRWQYPAWRHNYPLPRSTAIWVASARICCRFPV